MLLDQSYRTVACLSKWLGADAGRRNQKIAAKRAAANGPGIPALEFFQFRRKVMQPEVFWPLKYKTLWQFWWQLEAVRRACTLVSQHLCLTVFIRLHCAAYMDLSTRRTQRYSAPSLTFYASATVRCRRHTVTGSVRLWLTCVSAWVRAWVTSVSPTLWTPYLKNQWREFHQILVTDILRVVDVLIRFWGQKVKGQGHSRRRHNHRRLPVEFHLVLLHIQNTLCPTTRRRVPGNNM